MVIGENLMLIDMDTLSVGDPVFDLMGVYMSYLLFNEDEPDNTLKFLGLTSELCDFVYEKTLACYFSDRDMTATRELEKRIRAVAYVRFLYLVAVLDIGKPELRQLRVDHALASLGELANRVESLEVASLGTKP